MNQNSSVTVSGNCITQLSNYGIAVGSGNNNVIITNNTIAAPSGMTAIVISEIGTLFPNAPNTNIQINNNNISGAEIALTLEPNSYTGPDIFDAGNNWWNSPDGPNYNYQGPGTGLVIVDNNAVNTQTVIYEPYLLSPLNLVCSTPVRLQTTTLSETIQWGTPGKFTVSLALASRLQIPYTFPDTFFADYLPLPVPGQPGQVWTIDSQNSPPIFTMIYDPGLTFNVLGSSNLNFASVGTYTATVQLPTLVENVGQEFVNNPSIRIQYAGTLNYIQTISSTASFIVELCIHRSSVIKLANGTEKEIDKIEPGTKIIAADSSVVKIIEAVRCQISDPDGNCGTCIVFEPDSIAPGIPSKRFGADAGHPIGMIDTYSGNHMLKPAKEFINGSTIYAAKWDSVADLFVGDNHRYDIVMPEDSCGAYIANGVVVKSRQSRMEPGYNYL